MTFQNCWVLSGPPGSFLVELRLTVFKVFTGFLELSRLPGCLPAHWLPPWVSMVVVSLGNLTLGKGLFVLNTNTQLVYYTEVGTKRGGSEEQIQTSIFFLQLRLYFLSS